ncbi:MAG: GGDEF domain-containing protein [Candidatus Marinarcus sp.]|uniref:GGDEF domain-containing protein n=1 Tax=Candidatus Marinarcus sp. TaxID=3100987 RepID=UPI003AFF8573
MNHFDSKEIVQNLFTKKSFRIYIISTFILIILGLFVGRTILKPLFFDHMIKMVLIESQKISRHIQTHKEGIGLSINDELKLIKKNFEIPHIKLFDDKGIVIASTVLTEIGMKDSSAVQNKQKITYKVIYKDMKTLDNAVTPIDMAEINVPMFKKGNFDGAIEIYYDITYIQEEFNKIINKIDLMYYISSSFFLIVLYFILYRLSIADLYRKKHQLDIIELNETLKEKVQQRTKELEEKNAELKKLANFDSLTGIYNRAFFLKLANKYFEIAKRNKTSLFIMSFDLDHFKEVNDTYGHLAGDDVLKAFSTITQSYMRSSDLFGRVGGEEFLACIQNTQESGVKILGEKIRKALEKTAMRIKDEDVYITVSIGIAKLTDESNFDEVLEKSDKALYQVKESGRNRVILYSQN